MCLLFVLHLYDKSLLKFPKLALNLGNYISAFTPNIHEKKISILIGLDYYFLFIKRNVIRSKNGDLVALESKLG